MPTFQPSYGTRAAFGSVANLNSQATGTIVGVGAVDNSTAKAVNYKIDVNLTLASTGVSGAGQIVFYLLESADGTTYTDGLSPTGTGLAVKNARPIKTLTANANSQAIVETFDLPLLACPLKFAVLVGNSSGAALPSSGNSVSYTPITYTSI